VILVAFVWFVVWGVGSALLCLLGFAIAWFVQGPSAAADLATTWLFTFNGIIVGAAGYGTVTFICRERWMLVRGIETVLDVPRKYQPAFRTRIAQIASWRLTHLVAFIMTSIGGYIAWNAGIPLQGFSHLYLSIAVISYYYVGARGLMVFVALLSLFRYVETHAGPERPDRIRLRRPTRVRDLQAIDLYFILTSGLAILAVYVCFRTTLTAFQNAPPAYYKALLIPVLFFLPAALVYSFYPRWVLRQVWDTDTLVDVESFANEEELKKQGDLVRSLELRKLILEVKEKMLAERRAAPLFTFKDAPTLTLAILMLIQIVAQKDPILSNYFQTVFK